MLYLEVNITDGFKAKLMVFEGDDPEQVVTTFGEVYNLTQTKKSKLMSIVNKQMRNILVKIGETEEEEDDSNRNAQE